MRVEFNLNDVENKGIYQLETTNEEHKKKFSCAISVQFNDGSVNTKWTEPFLLLGTNKKGLGEQGSFATLNGKNIRQDPWLLCENKSRKNLSLSPLPKVYSVKTSRNSCLRK